MAAHKLTLALAVPIFALAGWTAAAHAETVLGESGRMGNGSV